MNNQNHDHRFDFESISGCILGTAMGDAVGLKREGLSRDRAIRLHGDQPSPDLIFGRGFCSDDTEHTILVAAAFLRSGGNVDAFKKIFAGYLKKWLLTLPAGIGLGTLRAILKSFLVGPDNSGVFTAGNGPAMRSALLGLLARDEQHMRELVRASTRLTHTDPKAEDGAFVVAKAARFAAMNSSADPIQFIEQLVASMDESELKQHLEAAIESLQSGHSPGQYVELRGWGKGPTGYINQSVPAAV